MAQDEKTIYVYENWRGEAPTLLGRLRCGFVRGQETFSFEYDPAWLSSAESSFSLDPDLALYRGRQYVPLNKQLFGLFSDSCPDRWGRLLMKRKEAIDARKEDRKPRKLTESDFLLGSTMNPVWVRCGSAWKKGANFFRTIKRLRRLHG